MTLDTALFNFFHGLAGLSGFLDWLFIFFSKYLGYFLIAPIIVLLWKEKKFQKRMRGIFLVVLSVILSRGLITEIIRFFYDRPRPFDILPITPLFSHDPGSALPSGHAAFYFALAFAVFTVNKRWGWVFFSATFLISVSRVIAGVHWPLDILAGAAVGFLSFFVAKYLLVSLKRN